MAALRQRPRRRLTPRPVHQPSQLRLLQHNGLALDQADQADQADPAEHHKVVLADLHLVGLAVEGLAVEGLVDPADLVATQSPTLR